MAANIKVLVGDHIYHMYASYDTTYAVCCSGLQRVAVGCSGLQCVAVCCSVLQCIVVCCSVYVAGTYHMI